jgi:hypothetical protein
MNSFWWDMENLEFFSSQTALAPLQCLGWRNQGNQARQAHSPGREGWPVTGVEKLQQVTWAKKLNRQHRSYTGSIGQKSCCGKGTEAAEGPVHNPNMAEKPVGGTQVGTHLNINPHLNKRQSP